MSFRYNEPESVRVPKLNALLASGAGELAVSINELPYAEAFVPLLRWRLTGGLTFSGGVADANVAASATTVLPIMKNGVANGNVTFVGSVGVVSFINFEYAPGDLLELYPPSPSDATLDQVSITFLAS